LRAPGTGHCLLTISLAQLWAPEDGVLEMCYKLVAGVVEL